MTRKLSIVFSLFLAMGIFAPVGIAQTTGFTYQGSLNSGGVVANGNHDFEFALFDALSGGAQLGATLPQNGVTVTNGIFAVSLDFGSQFPGAQRFLEIRVRPSGVGAFTPLTPRQQITSSPYAVKSLNSDTATTATNATNATNATTATNALQLGGVAANQYVITTDSRMTDERTPTAGSANYIQNQNAGAQAASSFNISGTGTAGGTLSGNIVNAATRYDIGGDRVLSVAGSANVFAGVDAGANTTGSGNSFFGRGAGRDNTSGDDNSFFGRGAGLITTGSSNSFFGGNAGGSNLTGAGNSIFGRSAGANTNGGSSNSFFGRSAGFANTGGSNNTIIGDGANVGSGSLTFATAIGANAVVSTSDTITLGRSAGQDTVQIPGALSVIATLTANAFTGSGAGLTALNASNITSGTLSNARLGVVPIANGGTGSAVQNFVDLTNAQTIGGNKTFSGTLSANAVNSTTQYNIGGSRVLSVAGTNNVFAGVGAGSVNTGQQNSFFGSSAGAANNTGSDNSFFGREAGGSNITGSANSFFGRSAGLNSTGFDNSVFGFNAGINNTTGQDNSFFGSSAGSSNTGGSNNTIIGRSANVGPGNLTFATAIGSNAVVSANNRIQLGRAGSDTVSIGAFAAATAINLCISGTVLATCSSSQRYKESIQPLTSGLNLIQRLRPVTFDWKERREPDLGLIAEEVAEIEPLLVTRNTDGVIEGVKYDQISVVLVNAVKEQQAQIEAQKKEIERQNAKIDALTRLVCASNKGADICKEQ